MCSESLVCVWREVLCCCRAAPWGGAIGLRVGVGFLRCRLTPPSGSTLGFRVRGVSLAAVRPRHWGAPSVSASGRVFFDVRLHIRRGAGGKRWFQLLADVDSPGVYALVMSQGTYHGNGCPKEDGSLRLPVCLGLASYTDRELRSFAACQFRDSAGMVARVGGDNLRKHLCNLWREDLQNIGGLPKGLPNSEKLGIQRSSGLGFGQASVAVRRCEGVRRLWDAAAVAVGRPPVFAGDYASAPCCTSFDGVLYTTTEHAYPGLARHVDTFLFETGQLQCFVVVWPRLVRTCGGLVARSRITSLTRSCGEGWRTPWSRAVPHPPT